MTAQEIRASFNLDVISCGSQPASEHIALMLTEIAAQLAEYNERSTARQRPLAGRQEQRSVVRRSSFTKTFHVSSWGISSATEEMLRQFIPNDDQPNLEDLEVSQTSVGALGTKTDVMVTRKS